MIPLTSTLHLEAKTKNNKGVVYIGVRLETTPGTLVNLVYVECPPIAREIIEGTTDGVYIGRIVIVEQPDNTITATTVMRFTEPMCEFNIACAKEVRDDVMAVVALLARPGERAVPEAACLWRRLRMATVTHQMDLAT
jgi:hypothetical protein